MAEIPPEAVAKVCAHPLRRTILEMLEAEPRSAKEIADELGYKLPTVCYHFDRLRKAGAIKLVRSKSRRGVFERYYRAVWRVRIQVEPIER
jgi:DNA-binding transcriptional ArsR family regulator